MGAAGVGGVAPDFKGVVEGCGVDDAHGDAEDGEADEHQRERVGGRGEDAAGEAEGQEGGSGDVGGPGLVPAVPAFERGHGGDACDKPDAGDDGLPLEL
ncbi:MAG: hypothetical protein AAFY46_12910, partial [Planctomycetota bacterium]